MTVTTEEAGVVTETHNLHFFYDAQSRPLFVTPGGKAYVCADDPQGDVIQYESLRPGLQYAIT